MGAFVVVVGLITITGFGCQKKESAQKEKPDTPTDAKLLKPEDLAKALRDPEEEKPLILHVGFPSLYEVARIPGSKHTGSSREPEGIEGLKREVENLSRKKRIILYCGCCPWEDCPNIRPASHLLQEMGFREIEALYLPNDFEQDWMKKGFPVEKGE